MANGVVYSQHPIELPVTSDRWRVKVEPKAWARRLNSFAWLKLRTAELSRHDALHVYWANTGFSPHLPARVRVVASVYDLAYRIVPQTMRRRSLLQYRQFFERDLRRADSVVSLSEGTAKRSRELLSIEIAAVATPGVAGHFAPPTDEQLAQVRRKHRLGQPYFLAVGTLEPRKNLQALIDAFERWQREHGRHRCELVLVGDAEWRDAELVRRLQATGPSVRTLGRVADADLASLYAGAVAFVYPSLYEGFGLPVLEARACGARIIASDTPEIREAGGSVPMYVRPEAAALASALAGAWSDRHTPAPLDVSSLPSWKRAGSVLAAHLGSPR